MSGTVLQVVDAKSFWLLVINTGDSIAEQPVESRYMADIVAGEGLADPYELVGWEVELSEDGMTLAFL